LALDNAAQDAILSFVMATMFIILPMFWISALGWAEMRVGTLLNGVWAAMEPKHTPRPFDQLPSQ
jgi:hypothetical protein